MSKLGIFTTQHSFDHVIKNVFKKLLLLLNNIFTVCRKNMAKNGFDR